MHHIKASDLEYAAACAAATRCCTGDEVQLQVSRRELLVGPHVHLQFLPVYYRHVIGVHARWTGVLDDRTCSMLVEPLRGRCIDSQEYPYGGV